MDDYPVVYARLLNHIGRYCWTQDRVHEAHAFLEKSQALSLKSGNAGELGLAETLNWWGLIYLFEKGYQEKAKAMLERGLAIYQKWRDERGIALNTFHLGIAERELDHTDLALSLLERSLSQFRQFGDLFFIARVSINLGYLFIKLGEYGQAQHLFEQHLEIDTRLSFWDGIADGWHNLSYLHRLKGEYEQASQFCEKSVLVCQEHLPDRKDTYFSSGVVALYLGNYALAFQRFSYLLHLIWGAKDQSNAGIYLRGLAAVAGETNQPERAAKLDGAARVIFEAGGRPLPPEEALEFDCRIQIAREQLGETMFEALVAEGRAMTLKQAIQLALN